MSDNTDDGVGAVKRPEVYAVLANLVTNSEQIRWTRLSFLLVLDSIFLVAWSAVFASSVSGHNRMLVLVILSLPGALLSFLWCGLGARSSDYVDDFHELAEAMENDFPKGLPRPFQTAATRRDAIYGPWRLTSSYWLVRLIPAVLGLLLAILGGLAVAGQ